MSNTKTNAQIDSHAYNAVAIELVKLVLGHGFTFTSINTVEQAIDQIVADAKLATPVITAKLPTVAYPLAKA